MCYCLVCIVCPNVIEYICLLVGILLHHPLRLLDVPARYARTPVSSRHRSSRIKATLMDLKGVRGRTSPHARAILYINNIQHFFFRKLRGGITLLACHSMLPQNVESNKRKQTHGFLWGDITRGILSSSGSHILVKTIADYDEDELRRMVRLSLPENTHIMMMDRP